MKLAYKILIPLILLFTLFSGLLYIIAVTSIDNFVLESKALNLIGSVNKQSLVFTDADLGQDASDTLLLQKMNLFIQQLADPSIVNANILDRNMTIIASDFQASVNKRESSNPYAQGIFNQTSGATWYIDSSQPNLGTLVKVLLPIKKSNGNVAYVLEISSATSGTLSAIQEHFLTIILLFVALGIIIAIGVYLLIYFQVLRPINHLIKAVKVVSEGNLSYKLSITSDDELGILTKEFNAMTLRLNASQMELERKVQDRTAELEQAKQVVEKRFEGQTQLTSQLEQTKKQLEEQLTEQQRLTQLMVGREIKISELTKENDELKARLGEK